MAYRSHTLIGWVLAGCSIILAGSGCCQGQLGGHGRVCGTCGAPMPNGCFPPVSPEAAAAGAPAMACVGYDNHPRFHPVPVRPVFAPRMPAMPMAMPPGPEQQMQQMPMPPNAPMPTEGSRAEEVPTPLGQMYGRPLQPGTRQGDWIFSPAPPPGPPGPQVTLPAEQSGGAKPRAGA